MKRLRLAILFSVLACCACTIAHAQKRKPELPMDTITSEVIVQDLLYRHPPDTEGRSEEEVFGGVEPQPEYPGGTHAMYKFISANLRMPAKARKAGVSGRVFTSFKVEVTGEITNVTVLKGLGFGCDEEAVRLVKSMPKWKPGKQNGQFVKGRYTLPIFFEPK
ncbi:TonB family C-terminal domain-containing protein [Dyadobacter soli]|uniref:TonB family C-terminal domain-containing protein n=1 Tax=Dyadobacter soli TaxID=659014 RepID=A0A1G7FVS7_9BACT|nr:energy transducer TonB [Dyadobacter soli]SDE79974.1 TonB family C-terminal domain-containing protein [Dyadobacter soli]